MNNIKTELVEELNEKLDSLSPARAREIFIKLHIKDLHDLNLAIDQMLKDATARQESTS